MDCDLLPKLSLCYVCIALKTAGGIRASDV